MSISECPNPEFHGNPFRYCACGWVEEATPIEEPLTPSEATTNDIENRFGYHAPKDDATVSAHELTRNQIKGLAHYWSNNLPYGREQALAITKLEEALFWANAAIARNQ